VGSVLLSMTGFGMGEASIAEGTEGTLRVELRAVNHRNLDVRVRTAHEIADVAALVEDEIRTRCVRGRVEANVRWEARAGTLHSLDGSRARSVYRALCALRDELAPGQDVPIVALASVPGLFAGTVRFDADTLAVAARSAATQACQDLARMRATEGTALREDMLHRVGLLRGHAAFVETQRPQIVEAARVRLKKRIEKLLEGSEIGIDSGRLVQEAAWFADKSDVTEELTRLDSHLRQFEQLLQGGGEQIGKRLDFLIQEIGREVNTTGSKANDAEVAQRVVEMKSELERLREQVQNVL